MGSRHFASSVVSLTLFLGLSAGAIRTSTEVAVAAAGNIEGHVKDRAGVALPGVLVTAIPPGGGLTKAATTDRAGVYRLGGLADDTYRVNFYLPGFSIERHNRVRVRADELIGIDEVLSVGAMCECIEVDPSTLPRPVVGQVVDEANRPLPHARLDIVGPIGRESAYADGEGRFLVRAVNDRTWPLTASESGFETVTREISSAVAEPVVLRLRYVGAEELPDTERLSHGCLCPTNLFVHERLQRSH